MRFIEIPEALNPSEYRSKYEDLLEFKFSSTPSDYPEARAIAERIIPRIKAIYREKSLLSMLRYSRGSVLNQNAQVLTQDMMEQFITKRYNVA